MVLIPLKSQYVSLIIMLVSGAAELTLLSALLQFNSFFECSILRRRRFLSINRHRTRITVLAFVALIVFVALEIVISFFSDPSFRVTQQRRSCLLLRPIDSHQEAVERHKKSRIISLGCAKTTERFETQYMGNLSLDKNNILCAKHAAYRFPLGEGDVHKLPISPHAEFGCSSEKDKSFCAFAFQQDKFVFFGGPIHGLDAAAVTSGQHQLHYFRTEVFFDTSGLLRTIAQRAAMAFSKFVTDAADLRLEVFSSTRQSSCLFGVKSDATEIALGAIVAIAMVWTISFCLFMVSIPFRLRVFYDMRNPLHWARKTTRDIEFPPTDDLVVVGEHQREGLFVYLQNISMDEKENVSER